MFHWLIKNQLYTHLLTISLSAIGVLLHVLPIEDSRMRIVSSIFLSFAAIVLYVFTYFWPVATKFIHKINEKTFGKNPLFNIKAEQFFKVGCYGTLTCIIGFFFQKPEAYISIAGTCGLLAGAGRYLHSLKLT